MRGLNADADTLFKALFPSQLPADVRRVLAGSATFGLDALALEADRITQAGKSTPGVVSGVAGQQKQPSTDLCYFHSCFGMEARNCNSRRCSLAHLVKASTPTRETTRPAASCGSIRPTSNTCRSSSCFQDCIRGWQDDDCLGPPFRTKFPGQLRRRQSLFPVFNADRRRTSTADLVAANGSVIKTYGRRNVPLLLANNRTFIQEFWRNLSTQRSPFFVLPRFLQSFRIKVCKVCWRP
jgi:hypothetical protein